MTSFDPNAAAAPDSGVFGLPFDESESSMIYLPVAWDATTSYKQGTAEGPAALLEASHQVDLYDYDVVRPYEAKMAFRPIDDRIKEWSESARKAAEPVIAAGGVQEGDAALESAAAKVNKLSEQLNDWVLNESRAILAQNKILAVVGGEHSVPFGAIQAVAEQHPSFGVLHIDAHSDTRNAFEGFQWSHASIMRNVLERIPQVQKLIQVGIRDFCEDEVNFCASQGERVQVYYDQALAEKRFESVPWSLTCKEIVSQLPKEVWISFDIDGLDPRFCPNTGTPVPGGLDFFEANHLIGAIVRSGRTILGFDLTEVAPSPEGANDWDANVGARMLYKLTAWTFASRGLCRLNKDR